VFRQTTLLDLAGRTGMFTLSVSKLEIYQYTAFSLLTKALPILAPRSPFWRQNLLLASNPMSTVLLVEVMAAALKDVAYSLRYPLQHRPQY